MKRDYPWMVFFTGSNIHVSSCLGSLVSRTRVCWLLHDVHRECRTNHQLSPSKLSRRTETERRVISHHDRRVRPFSTYVTETEGKMFSLSFENFLTFGTIIIGNVEIGESLIPIIQISNEETHVTSSYPSLGKISPNTVVIIGTSDDGHRNTIDRLSFITKHVFERFDVLLALVIGRNTICRDQ